MRRGGRFLPHLILFAGVGRHERQGAKLARDLRLCLSREQGLNANV